MGTLVTVVCTDESGTPGCDNGKGHSGHIDG